MLHDTKTGHLQVRLKLREGLTIFFPKRVHPARVG